MNIPSCSYGSVYFSQMSIEASRIEDEGTTKRGKEKKKKGKEKTTISDDEGTVSICILVLALPLEVLYITLLKNDRILSNGMISNKA